MKFAALALISLLSVVAFAGPIRDKTLNSALASLSTSTSGGVGLSIAHAGSSASADGNVAEARASAVATIYSGNPFLNNQPLHSSDVSLGQEASAVAAIHSGNSFLNNQPLHSSDVSLGQEASAVATIYSGNPFLNNQPLHSSGLSLERKASQVAFASGNKSARLFTKPVDRVSSKLSNVFEVGKNIGCFGDKLTDHAITLQLEKSERDNSFDTELNQQHEAISQNSENLASSSSRLGASEIQKFETIASVGGNQNKGSNENQGSGALNGKVTYFAQSGPVIHIVTADNDNKNEVSGQNQGYGSTSAAGTVLELGEVRDQHAQELLNLASHGISQDQPSVGLLPTQVAVHIGDSEDSAKVYDSSKSSGITAQSNIHLDGSFQNSYQNEQSSSSSSHSTSEESSSRSSSSHSASHNIESYASNDRIQDAQNLANSAILSESQNQLSGGLSSSQLTVSVAHSSAGQLDQSASVHDSSKSSGIIAQSNVNLDGSVQSSHRDTQSSSSLSQSASEESSSQSSSSHSASHNIASSATDVRSQDAQNLANSAILSESQNQLSGGLSSSQLTVSVAHSSAGQLDQSASVHDSSKSSGIIAQSNVNLDGSVQSSHRDTQSSSSLSQSASEESSSQSSSSHSDSHNIASAATDVRSRDAQNLANSAILSESQNQLSGGLSSSQLTVSVAHSSAGQLDQSASVHDSSKSSGIIAQSNVNLDGSVQSSHRDTQSSSSLSQSASEESSSQSSSSHSASHNIASSATDVRSQDAQNLANSAILSESQNQLSGGLSSSQLTVSVAHSSAGQLDQSASVHDSSKSSGIIAQSNVNLDGSVQSSHRDTQSSSSLSQSASEESSSQSSSSHSDSHNIASAATDVRSRDAQNLANSAILSESQNQLSGGLSSSQLTVSVAHSSAGQLDQSASVHDSSKSSGIIAQSNVNLDGSVQSSHRDTQSSSSLSQSASEESSSQSSSSHSASHNIASSATDVRSQDAQNLANSAILSESQNQLSGGLSSSQLTVSVAHSSAGQLDQSASVHDSSKSSGIIAQSNVNLDGSVQSSHRDTQSSSSLSQSASEESSSQSSSSHSDSHNIASAATDVRSRDAQNLANSAILSESQNQLSGGLSSSQLTVSVAHSSAGQLDQSASVHDSSKSSGIIAQSNVNLDGSVQSSHRDTQSSSSLSQSASEESSSQSSSSHSASHNIASSATDVRSQDAQNLANSAILSESQNQLSGGLSSSQLTVSVAHSSAGHSEHNANAYDTSISSGIIALGNIGLHGSLQTSNQGKKSSTSSSPSASESSSQSSSSHSASYNIAPFASGDVSHQRDSGFAASVPYGGSQVQQSTKPASGFLHGVVNSAVNTSKRLLFG